MKQVLSFSLLILVFTSYTFAQSAGSSKVVAQEKSVFFRECDPEFAIVLGYVPKSEFNALKASFDFNNIILKRFGAYTSFEKGLDSDYFTNIYGLTASIHPKIYFFGGVDLFTKSGLFTHDEDGGVRKELGIGYNPWKKLVFNLGWSSTVGITFGAGMKIPL